MHVRHVVKFLFPLTCRIEKYEILYAILQFTRSRAFRRNLNHEFAKLTPVLHVSK
jgi:hypothetical protein